MNVYDKFLSMAEANPGLCIVISLDDFCDLLQEVGGNGLPSEGAKEIDPVTEREILRLGLYATIPKYQVGIVVRKNTIKGHFNLEKPSPEIAKHLGLAVAATPGKGTIAIDFDGVIHSYTSKWCGVSYIPDPPVDGAFDFIKALLDEGYEVVIYSTRCVDRPEHRGGAEAIRNWLAQHDLEDKYLNALKLSGSKPAAIMYIDDRAWNFSGKFPTMEEVKNFRPWTGKDSSSKTWNAGTA